MELNQRLSYIFNLFDTNHSFKNFQTFSSGHINDTYLIYTYSTQQYVLQQLNGTVFKNAKDVIQNKVAISQYLIEKGSETIQFLPTKNSEFYILDKNNQFWCLSKYIQNSQTFLKATSNTVAFQAGFATGKFLNDTTNFTGILIETLPKFHSMEFRFQEFQKALTLAIKERIDKAKKYIDFVHKYIDEMLVIDKALENKRIPLRVTHNDTKISNILFDRNEHAICMIDLDTVMLGCIHFDYGDALRTICSTANEDETDLKKVDFNLDYFKNYTIGFFQSLKNTLTQTEIELLSHGPKIMTFIMGLRFLTDYLNNDVYYKTLYSEHNLDRAINQFTLVSKIIENKNDIVQFIENLPNKP
ncbi:Phosphotransferase family enzyme [Tenacibaculum sp. 190130A14a]|uniref:N-acetylhexosamine 1-kinase n=1 Tax=Tenacibaculum polynesiense TaxID=3137857 RepID=A0ABP1F402_9FLAO